MSFHRRALLSLFLLGALFTRANNIQVANASLTNVTATTALVQFDLSWENSWRTINANNWDAAWVFVKYRTPAGVWQHVNLNNTGHVAAIGSQVDLGLLTPTAAYNATTNPVVGVFVRRNADGTGTLNLPGTQLQWNFGALGLNYADIAQVQVFAIEMVYVPQGSFAVGSGGAEFTPFPVTTINTATASTVPAGTGSLGGQAGGYPTGQTAPAATWPNGFGAFYCMKYEVSQQAYVDFLNTLTYTQQITRTAIVPSSPAGTGALVTGNTNRSGIDIMTPGLGTPAVYACNLNGNGVYGEATDGKDIACGWLSWADLGAYLDWSGLRPMTELEFEKACRGTALPLANEYPWGGLNTTSSGYTLSNAGASNEGINLGYLTLGNALSSLSVGSIGGPVRVGIFAANAGNTGRVTAGAGYYGCMELGGNLFERAVNLSSAAGRAFTGVHGNGTLLGTGEQDVTNWPAAATADGTGFRGGSFQDVVGTLRTSDRTYATNALTARSQQYGGRGVRTP